MVALKKTSDQQGCQISTSELPDSWVSMYLPKYWDYEARNQYLPIFGHEKSNGDIQKDVRLTGLPDFDNSVAIFVGFQDIFKTIRTAWLKICTAPFLDTRDRMETFKKVSDLQG